MKCIIIDDELMSREILSILVDKTKDLILDQEFSNAIDAVKFLNEENDVDLIFLDIHMPIFTGIDFIKTIKNPPQVILITSDKDFALEAFNYDCITDYLIKPVVEKRFQKAIQRAVLKKNTSTTPTVSNSNTEAQKIYVNIDKRLVKIDFASIRFIKSNGDYIVINTETINYSVHTTLKKIEEKLPSTIFLKIHRSYIINLNKIIDIQDATVLIGKELIPISKNRRAVLMKSLNCI